MFLFTVKIRFIKNDKSEVRDNRRRKYFLKLSTKPIIIPRIRACFFSNRKFSNQVVHASLMLDYLVSREKEAKVNNHAWVIFLLRSSKDGHSRFRCKKKCNRNLVVSMTLLFEIFPPGQVFSSFLYLLYFSVSFYFSPFLDADLSITIIRPSRFLITFHVYLQVLLYFFSLQFYVINWIYRLRATKFPARVN